MAEFYTTVDDELYDELCELEGQPILHFALWDDSFGEELSAMSDKSDKVAKGSTDNPTQITFDLDLYLEDGIYFELYSVAFFPTLEGEPWQGFETVQSNLRQILRSGLRLEEVAVDEEDALVLVCKSGQTSLYLQVGGWELQEWDELPT